MEQAEEEERNRAGEEYRKARKDYVRIHKESNLRKNIIEKCKEPKLF